MAAVMRPTAVSTPNSHSSPGFHTPDPHSRIGIGGRPSPTTARGMHPGYAQAMVPGPPQLTPGSVGAYGLGFPAGAGGDWQPVAVHNQPVSPMNSYAAATAGPGQTIMLSGQPSPFPHPVQVGTPPAMFPLQPVPPISSGMTAGSAPRHPPAAMTGQQPASGGPQGAIHVVGARDVAKMVGGRFLDLKCFSRLPGLKPRPAQIVNGILDLALIWVDLDIYMRLHNVGTLALVDPLDFGTCWHIGQDHRSLWEEVFRLENKRPTSDTYGVSFWAPELANAADKYGPTLLRPVLNATTRSAFEVTVAKNKAYGITYNKLRNHFADIFQNRTSVPYCVGFKPAWPPRPPRQSHAQLFRDDLRLFNDLNRTLDGFHTLREVASYGSHEYISRLATTVGLPDAANTVTLLYRRRALRSSNPRLPEAFGTLLHRVPEQQACFYIIGIACCGVYRGHHGWQRLAGALAQGAWPWLRGYSKAYAKAIYVLMVSLCCAVELGYLDGAIFPLLMALAGCLVGRLDVAGGSQWRIRHDPRLRDVKVLIQAIPHPVLPEQDGQPMAAYANTPALASPAQQWGQQPGELPRLLSQPQPQFRPLTHSQSQPQLYALAQAQVQFQPRPLAHARSQPQIRPESLVQPPLPTHLDSRSIGAETQQRQLASLSEVPRLPVQRANADVEGFNKRLPSPPAELGTGVEMQADPQGQTPAAETSVAGSAPQSGAVGPEGGSSTPRQPAQAWPALPLPMPAQAVQPQLMQQQPALQPPGAYEPFRSVQPMHPGGTWGPAAPAQPPQTPAVPISPHVPPQPWTFLACPPPTPAVGSRSFNHIIAGTDCNHGPSAVVGVRVRVAYSLAEVQSLTADGLGLTVALTQFDERARDEVEQWVKFTRTLTVKRTENMCISCSVKLAHIVSALLIIG